VEYLLHVAHVASTPTCIAESSVTLSAKQGQFAISMIRDIAKSNETLNNLLSVCNMKHMK